MYWLLLYWFTVPTQRLLQVHTIELPFSNILTNVDVLKVSSYEIEMAKREKSKIESQDNWNHHVHSSWFYVSSLIGVIVMWILACCCCSCYRKCSWFLFKSVNFKHVLKIVRERVITVHLVINLLL